MFFEHNFFFVDSVRFPLTVLCKVHQGLLPLLFVEYVHVHVPQFAHASRLRRQIIPFAIKSKSPFKTFPLYCIKSKKSTFISFFNFV